MSRAIFLLGPTASGKTALALHLADHFPVDIISVDSALVYRGMNIGTAKPDAETLAKYPHRLVDLIDPVEAYSAARFCRDATFAIDDLIQHGRIPLLVGGTMLYAKALLEGLSDMPAADVVIREQLESEAQKVGWAAMHAELARIDPATAARLTPGDSQRIQRALEVYRITGKPISTLQKRDAPPLGTGVVPTHAAFPHRALKIGLVPGERSVLHERIASRFDAMLAEGLVDEVQALRRDFVLDAAMPSMRCVGYRQAWQYLDGEIDSQALRETGIAATRQLAKRQMTWLRSMPDFCPLDCLRLDLHSSVVTQVGNFLDVAST